MYAMNILIYVTKTNLFLIKSKFTRTLSTFYRLNKLGAIRQQSKLGAVETSRITFKVTTVPFWICVK